MNRTVLLPAAALLMMLAACGPTPTEPDPIPSSEQTQAPSSTPTSSAPASAAPETPELAEDVVMVVSAVATADTGEALDLTLTIHRATAWDDAAGADRAALMTDVCAGYMDDLVYEMGLYSFTTIDVDAALRDGADWPADRRVFVIPNGTFATVATDGYPADDDEADPNSPHCARGKFLDAPGSGVIVMGLRGDDDSATAAGNFTKWANHSYGFSAVRAQADSAANAGVTLSDCEYLVTPAGQELGGQAESWGTLVDDTHCLFGSTSEESDF